MIESGSVRFSKELQEKKACFPIETTVDGMVTMLREEQEEKAPLLMLLTDSEIKTECRL